MKRFGTSVAMVALLASVAAPVHGGAAAGKPSPSPAPAAPARGESAVFAGGCFWCMETVFEQRPGVLSVVSGYTGGKEERPTYEQVSSHGTGHFEAIEIRFDPAKVSYARLLDLFWHSVDPTQDDGQFCDRGHQYRAAIFAAGAAQRAAAEKSRRDIEASGVLKRPIVTEILPAAKFWPAEDYHQDFWKKDPIRYRSYRFGCGRDQRLTQLWGAAAAKPNVH